MELSKWDILLFGPPWVIGNYAELVQYNFCEAPSCTEELKLKPAFPLPAEQFNLFVHAK